mmetsp:Transcript_32866/g.63108  ORF Transcript_32866/g.63108 Transcript_32866/m.63108 type:complete len:208 (+) Transcript_32866:816-1439(+)
MCWNYCRQRLSQRRDFCPKAPCSHATIQAPSLQPVVWMLCCRRNAPPQELAQPGPAQEHLACVEDHLPYEQHRTGHRDLAWCCCPFATQAPFHEESAARRQRVSDKTYQIASPEHPQIALQGTLRLSDPPSNEVDCRRPIWGFLEHLGSTLRERTPTCRAPGAPQQRSLHSSHGETGKGCTIGPRRRAHGTTHRFGVREICGKLADR